MSWERMTKVVERYERLVGGELRELKKLQKDIIECPNLDTSSARRQVEQLEEQLLSGLQKLLSMRVELDEAGQELFDTRIEPIRRQIQVAISMNKKLPETRTSSGFFETTIEDEANPYEMESRRYQQSIDEQSVQRRQLAEEAKAKAEATAKLAKDMKDLEEIFTELATIVHDQHDMVDSIEEHVERAVQDVQRGNEQLKKAVQHKTARAPVLAAVVGGLAVGGPVGVAAGSAIAGIAAGVGGLVAGIYTGKWFKNAVRRDLEPSPSSS